MATLNGVTFQANSNLVIPSTSGTPVNGTIKYTGGQLQIYFGGSWKIIK